MLGIARLYLPFRIPKGQLQAYLDAYDAVPVKGYSVTIPHKEAAAAAARLRDDTVERTHAANTLVRAERGFTAANTDYQSALESLWESLPRRADGSPADLHKRPVLILGAGGVARAIAHALHHAGCSIWVASRTYERAAKLAREVSGEPLDWLARHKEGCEIVINCTPVGMHPNVDESPIHAGFLRPGMHVFDTVYTPETTLLIREAKSRGCGVITGVEMFVRQAARQFELFTNKTPDLDKMREIVRKAMSPITGALEREADDAAQGI